MHVQETSGVSPVLPQRAQGSDVKPSSPLPVKEARQPSSGEIEAVVERINNHLLKNDVSLDFSVDETTSIPVVKVTNTTTGDIVMQFPSKVVLAISEAITNKQAGALVQDHA